MRLFLGAILCLILVACSNKRYLPQANSQVVIFSDSIYDYSISTDILITHQFRYVLNECKLDTSFYHTAVVFVHNPLLHSYDGSHPRVYDTIVEKFTYQYGGLRDAVHDTVNIQNLYSKKLSDMTLLSFSNEKSLKIASDSCILLIEHINCHDHYYGYNDFFLNCLERSLRKR